MKRMKICYVLEIGKLIRVLYYHFI